MGDRGREMKIKLKKELKPCPFCGSLVREAEGIGGLLFFACTNYAGCGAMISFDQKTANAYPEKAIDMYNRRSQ
jgi:hypothetical protein